MTKQKAFTKAFEAIEHDIADLSRRHEKADSAAHGIGHSMKLGVHAAFRAPDQPIRTRFFTRRLDAVRWGLRSVALIMTVLPSVPAAERPSIIKTKTP